MRRIAIIAVTVFVALAVSVPLALAQGTYTQIDYPGTGVNTYATGINSAGDVSGYYWDSTSHGFLLRDGTFTTVDYPGASATLLWGINDLGKVVGSAQVIPSLGVGFSYDIQSQTFTEIIYPNSHTVLTSAYGINNTGTIVGTAQEMQGANVVYVGFELDNGVYRKIAPRGFPDTFVTGINNLGEAVGNTSGNGSSRNFLFAQGRFQHLSIPEAVYPRAQGVNDSDAIVGVSSFHRGHVGFLYQSGTTQLLGFPGSTEMNAQSINNTGQVVGSFLTGVGDWHGFLWTPPADPAKK